jgi:hypothetical protein
MRRANLARAFFILEIPLECDPLGNGVLGAASHLCKKPNCASTKEPFVTAVLNAARFYVPRSAAEESLDEAMQSSVIFERLKG